jgi:hypothetical protein
VTTTAEDITVDSAEDTEDTEASVEDTAAVIIIIITLTKYFSNSPSYCNLIFTTAANELIPVLPVT